MEWDATIEKQLSGFNYGRTQKDVLIAMSHVSNNDFRRQANKWIATNCIPMDAAETASDKTKASAALSAINASIEAYRDGGARKLKAHTSKGYAEIGSAPPLGEGPLDQLMTIILVRELLTTPQD